MSTQLTCIEFWPPGVNAGKRALYDCLGNVVLAHASVAKLAKNKYPQHGLKFGMPLIISYGVPFSDSQADRDLSSKHNAHQTDIYWGPLIEGDYPAYTRGVRDNWISGDYLVTFTDAQKELLKGTLDYLAVNVNCLHTILLIINVSIILQIMSVPLSEIFLLLDLLQEPHGRQCTLLALEVYRNGHTIITKWKS